jgi:hypothetical protein
MIIRDAMFIITDEVFTADYSKELELPISPVRASRQLIMHAGSASIARSSRKIFTAIFSYPTVEIARYSPSAYIEYYNERRPHQEF